MWNMSSVKTQTGTLIGYARVSTQEQNLGMQIDALKAYGVAPNLIFTEKVSGASRKRPARGSAFRQCRAGDTFVVWRTDRVGRNAIDVLTFLEKLEAEGIKFKSLTDSMDTTTAAGKAMLSMGAVFAEFERETTRERIRAGVKRAMADGVKFGKATIFTEANQKRIAVWIKQGKSAKEISKLLKCHANSYRRVYTAEVIAAIRAGKKPKIVTAVRKKG